MLNTHKLLLLITLIHSLNCDQLNNFDYATNGQDWTGDCANNGNKQSPIQLSETTTTAYHDSYLFGDFAATDATIYFYNTTVYINTTDSFGSIYTSLIDGNSVPFKATQIRIRVHSEHKIQDNYSDLQLQIFHTQLYLTTRNYRFAIALLFNVGEQSDSFIQTIINSYEALKDSDKVEDIKNVNATINLGYLFTKNMIQNFWYYVGSPTIPNCRNGQINWVVYNKIHSISDQQLTKITDIIRGDKQKQGWSGNWRKIQPLNGNKVGYRDLGSQF